MPELKTLLSSLLFGESPRWHDNRLWCIDVGAHEVIAVDLEGNREVIVRVPKGPSAMDWLRSWVVMRSAARLPKFS